jgi:hypothetical protein
MARHNIRGPGTTRVVAAVALIVALGGTRYAAFSSPVNSGGTKQIKNGAVTATKLAKSVTVSSALHAYHTSSADAATFANRATARSARPTLQMLRTRALR